MIGVSGDGSRVVVSVAPEGLGHPSDLFSLSVDASSPARTLSALTNGLAEGAGARFTADGSRVVFVTTDDELWSAPADGAAAEVFLRGGTEEFVVTGSEVVFTALGPSGFRRVFAGPADGSAPSRLISGTFELFGSTGGLVLSPDGSRVVFRAREEVEPHGLIVARVDGASAPIRLTPPELQVDSSVAWVVSFDGLGVAFVCSEWVSAHSEHIRTLYVASLDGTSGPVVRSGPGIPAGGVSEFCFSAVDDRLVYVADLETDDVAELYTVRAISGAGHAKLSSPLPFPTWDVHDVVLSPDAAFVSYESGPELRIVPVDGSAPARLVASWSGGSSGEPHLLGFHGARILYSAGGEVFSEPVDGSAPPVRLSEPRWLR
jgi:hypothetical protein